jgi:hypothetical protein
LADDEAADEAADGAPDGAAVVHAVRPSRVSAAVAVMIEMLGLRRLVIGSAPCGG